MSVDLTEPTTPPAQRLGKERLYIVSFLLKISLKKEAFHKTMKRPELIVKSSVLIVYKNNKVWYRKIGDSNTTNLWRHVEVHHPEKDPRPNKKAKKLIAEGQNTLDEFVGQTEVPSKVGAGQD
ncbi:unnamed protein product [Rhizophagus irregularis]|nr:unnamed protein product [Rhizophagus irregularis]